MAPADFQGMQERNRADASNDQSGPLAASDSINFVKEAFHLQYNWIAMVSAGAFAIVSGSLLPIILGGGLELMYLAIVPQNWRFQRLVRSWKFAEEQQKQQQQYLKSTEQDGIMHEIASLQKTLSSDSPKVQEINKKRIEILTKRLEKFDKISENRKVVDAQCSAVEDVLMLVRDQSVTMRDPQQVTDRLDGLVHDVEETEQTVQQVEAIFSGMSPDLDGLMSLDDTSSS